MEKDKTMVKEQFEETKPYKKKQQLIDQIDELVTYYNKTDLAVSIRQVYYRLLSKGLVRNSHNGYRDVIGAVQTGRLTGQIDWDTIEDRTRRTRQLTHWETPQEIIDSAVDSYHIDLQENQDYHIELFCEKDTVVNIIEQIAQKYDIPLTSNRGYSSLTNLYNLAKRMDKSCKPCIILYFGDHDPSGLDMVRDIEKKIKLFTKYSIRFSVVPCALSMEQITKLVLVPDCTKEGDKRSPDYVSKFGNRTWELDALDPEILAHITEESILKFMNMSKFNEKRGQLERERDALHSAQWFFKCLPAPKNPV
jgi:hypothetical protein